MPQGPAAKPRCRRAMQYREWQEASDRLDQTAQCDNDFSGDRRLVQFFLPANHESRFVTHTSAAWPNRSISPCFSAPRRRATAWDAPADLKARPTRRKPGSNPPDEFSAGFFLDHK